MRWESSLNYEVCASMHYIHFTFDREDFQLWTVTLLTLRWHWGVLIPATTQGGGDFNCSISHVFLIYGAPRPATSSIMWKSSTCLAISNVQQSANKLHTINHWYISIILKQWYSFMFRTLQFHQQGIRQVVLYKTHLIICATCWRTQKCTASNPCRMVHLLAPELFFYFSTPCI